MSLAIQLTLTCKLAIKRMASAIARAIVVNAAMMRAVPFIVVTALFLSGCIRSRHDLSREIASVNPLLPGDYVDVKTGMTWSVTYDEGEYRAVYKKDGAGDERRRFKFFRISENHDLYVMQINVDKANIVYTFSIIRGDDVIIYEADQKYKNPSQFSGVTYDNKDGPIVEESDKLLPFLRETIASQKMRWVYIYRRK